MCRDFIWGTTANARKCHLVACSAICRPTEEGGLGFRNLRVLNEAYMMKLGWQTLEFPNKLWVRIMKAKYGCGPQAMPHFAPHHHCSRTWKGIVTAWPLISSNLRWVLRNGLGVQFWKDHWIPGVPSLHDHCPSLTPNAKGEFSVPIMQGMGCGNGSSCGVCYLLIYVKKLPQSNHLRRAQEPFLAGVLLRMGNSL